LDYKSDSFDPPKGAMVATTTSIKEWKDCKRKWYLTRVAGMPQPANAAFRIGSILHLCVERWLLCPQDTVPAPGQLPDQPVDEHGNYGSGSVLYNQTPGNQVDLFPHEWWKYQDRDGRWNEIDEPDQELVKALVREGISNGTVVRLPEGQVEKKFWLPLDGNQGLLWLTSLADYHSAPLATLEDHKTTKSLRWAVNEDTIADNYQLQIYALWMCDEYGIEDGVHVAHNIFIKDYLNPRTKKVQGFISKDRTEEMRSYLRSTVQEMLDLRDASPDWEEVTPNWSSCDSYGGCVYRGICSNLESISDFQLRMNPPTPTSPQLASGPPPLANSAPAVAKPNLETARGKAPWAAPACPVCGGLGVQINGSACPHCQTITGILPMNYTWGWNTQGDFEVWHDAPEHTRAAAPEPEPEPEPTPGPEPAAPVEVPDQGFGDRLKVVGKEGYKGKGRPPKAFTLYIDCLPSGGIEKVWQLSAALKVISDLYQERVGESYWAADTWKRRDFQQLCLPDVIAAVDKEAVYVNSDIYEIKQLAGMLEAHAGKVVRSTASR
jgi:hypothetical protein